MKLSLLLVLFILFSSCREVPENICSVFDISYQDYIGVQAEKLIDKIDKRCKKVLPLEEPPEILIGVYLLCHEDVTIKVFFENSESSIFKDKVWDEKNLKNKIIHSVDIWYEDKEYCSFHNVIDKP